MDQVKLIQGDLSEKGLGISENDIQLMHDVNVVFHTAASVRFDEPLKDALLSTVRGTRDLLEISKGFKKLQAFIYISTAYSNCQDGTPEEVLEHRIEERLYEDIDDWATAIKVAEHTDEEVLNTLTKL